MEAFLAQVAAAARKASDQGYCKQGRPPVQEKSAAAGQPMKKGAGRQRSPCAAAINKARDGNEEQNTHSHKALNRHSCIRQCHSRWREVAARLDKQVAGLPRSADQQQELAGAWREFARLQLEQGRAREAAGSLQ